MTSRIEDYHIYRGCESWNNTLSTIRCHFIPFFAKLAIFLYNLDVFGNKLNVGSSGEGALHQGSLIGTVKFLKANHFTKTVP